MSKHPGYLLDTPVNTYCQVRHYTTIENCEFISGTTDHMEDWITNNTTFKLSPTTVQASMNSQNTRRTKVNFATLTPGTIPRLKTEVFLTRYHYTAMWGSLGRIKIIPVTLTNPPYTDAIEYIKEFLNKEDLVNNMDTPGGNGYIMNDNDVTRIQGDDLRQAVQCLDSSIDFAIATGGDATTLNDYRNRIKTQVMDGSGTFEQVRKALHDLKIEGTGNGVLRLSKLEQDAGLSYLTAGDGSTPIGPS